VNVECHMHGDVMTTKAEVSPLVSDFTTVEGEGAPRRGLWPLGIQSRPNVRLLSAG
jgi:hypothetical protein